MKLIIDGIVFIQTLVVRGVSSLVGLFIASSVFSMQEIPDYKYQSLCMQECLVNQRQDKQACDKPIEEATKLWQQGLVGDKKALLSSKDSFLVYCPETFAKVEWQQPE